MKKKLLSIFLVCVLVASAALAQDKRITGKVTAREDGLPLPGVSVKVSGTNIGTQTDANGVYSINIPSAGKSLEFSFIGFLRQTLNIGAKTNINAVLENDQKQLSEVIVTGVGSPTDRRKVAIAVETVSSKDLPSVPSGSIDQALVGKIAGAQIVSTSGQPGQQASILLRGINSLGSTQPMILIDGVQVNAGNNANGSGSNLSSRLSDLDLSNIDRVEVVQGAAAATIYGAQGANGVIQIFTKRGVKDGQTRISFSSRASFDNAIRGDFALAQNHYYRTDANGFILSDLAGNPKIVRSADGLWDAPSLPPLTGALVNNKPFKEETFNHFDQIFKSNVPTYNHNINISGGAEKFDYAVNASQLNQTSTINGDLKRTNLSLNIGSELFKNFTIRATTQLIVSDNNTGGITGANNINSALGTALSSRQFWDIKFKDTKGNFVSNPELQNSVNPFYNFQFREYDAKNTRIVQGLDLNYKLPKFLTLNYKFGIDNYRYDFSDKIGFQLNTATPGAGITPINGRITYDRDSETLINSLATAYIATDFKKDFNFNIPIQTNTQISYDYRKSSFQSLTTQGTGFPAFPPFSINAAATKDNSQTVTDFVTFGYLVNQKIDYADLFGVSGGFRVDYSSAFGAGSEPFFFPRGDAYFRIGELLKSKTFYDVKLRGAYGEAGVQPGAYDRFIILNSGNIGNSGSLSLPATARNPNLGVQKSKEAEVGLDLGIALSSSKWLSALKLNATFWDRKSEDVIRAIDLPLSAGTGAILDNALSFSSQGFQFSLDADVLNSPNLKWNFATRFGTTRTIVDKISNGRDIVVGGGGSGQFVIREGEPLGAFFGKVPLSSVDQLNPNGVRYIPEANVNDFVIANGMVVNKTTKAVSFTSDQTKIGDPNPDFNVSFVNTFSIFKNLGLSFQIDWVQGNQAYNQTKQWLYRDLIHSDLDKEVTIGSETGAFVNYYNSLYQTNNTNSFFVEDASFVRFRDLSINYNFSDLIKLKRIKNAQLTFSGRNLFTITNYSGMDPEAAANINNPLNRGLDLYAFPNFRSYQLGISLGF